MYRHSFSVTLAKQLSRAEKVSRPIEAAIVFGELMFKSMTHDSVRTFFTRYGELADKFSYFSGSVKDALDGIQAVGLAEFGIYNADGEEVTGDSALPFPDGEGEFVKVELNDYFAEMYESEF